MTDLEVRILSYLDQHGATHRVKIVFDLASPESKFGQIRDGKPWGNARHNAVCALIFGKWSKSLLRAGFVREVVHQRGHYRAHEITPAGRTLLRAGKGDM